MKNLEKMDNEDIEFAWDNAVFMDGGPNALNKKISEMSSKTHIGCLHFKDAIQEILTSRYDISEGDGLMIQYSEADHEA